MRYIIAVPCLILLIVFALSPVNRMPVRIGIWPTDYTWETPLSLAILIAMAVAFLLGALIVWFSALAQRARARRAERRVQDLQDELQDLRERAPHSALRAH